jgi:hypothetical protein
LLLVPLALSAAPGDSGVLRFTGSISFHPLSTALDSTAVDSTASAVDFWVGVESSTNQSSLFSSFNLQQPPNLVTLPKTEFTFSRVGWTVGMEWKFYNQDTGQIRSVDPLI